MTVKSSLNIFDQNLSDLKNKLEVLLPLTIYIIYRKHEEMLNVFIAQRQLHMKPIS